MKRTQVWCDQCGREMKDTRDDGTDTFDAYDLKDSWEIWSTDFDFTYCSLECLIAGANNLATAQVLANNQPVITMDGLNII